MERAKGSDNLDERSAIRTSCIRDANIGALVVARREDGGCARRGEAGRPGVAKASAHGRRLAGASEGAAAKGIVARIHSCTERHCIICIRVLTCGVARRPQELAGLG